VGLWADFVDICISARGAAGRECVRRSRRKLQLVGVVLMAPELCVGGVVRGAAGPALALALGARRY
jgi:hypothetical protein